VEFGFNVAILNISRGKDCARPSPANLVLAGRLSKDIDVLAGLKV
jgi:hypothetical protein